MTSQPTEQRNPRQSFFSHLLRSHMIVAAIGAFSLLIGLVTIFVQARNVDLLSRNSIPISQASSSVLSGVHHSLASLRGWVSLDDERFVRDWYHVWEDEIHPAAIRLDQLGTAINLPGFNKRMAELSLLLAELEESQWWVLEIVQTPGNEPAKVKYQFEAEPILTTLDEIIRSLFIFTDKGLVISLQDAGRNSLHEAGISFYATRDMLERIVFQGEVDLEEQFLYNMNMLRTAVSGLSRFSSANDRLETMMMYFNREPVALNRVSTEIIAIRKSYNWNVARHLMETETVPLANKVVKVMKGLNRDTDNLMIKNVVNADRLGKFATLGLSVLLIAMIYAAIMVSRKRAMALSRPVTALATAANQLAVGSLTEDISPVSDDELGDLTRSFNTMRRDLHDAQKNMVRQEKLAAIGKLSGSVAHDIRNPLNAISNSIYFLNLVSNEKTDDKIKEHVAIMAHEINRANGIINDLLDFSRENVPIFADGDMNLLLQHIVSGFNFSEETTVDLQLDADLPLITFDHSQLQRVFNNLVANASQAMPDGGILQVHTAHDDESVCIKVSDSGHGIAEENLGEIFEPLFTTKATGVGLGLPIVKDFVEKHHGGIKVESVVGKGATFTVRLPVQQNAK